MKTQIAIEEIVGIDARRRQINALDLNDIEWMLDGEPVDIPVEVVEKFIFTGLNNVDFILTGYYTKEKVSNE